MNKTDRKQAAAILATLRGLKEQMEAQQSLLEDMAEAEREKFDNMSEGLQESERGQAMEEAANHLDNAASALDSGNIDEAIDALEELENM